MERAHMFHAPDAGMLRRFVEQTPVAIAMFDQEVRYLAASQRWLDDYRLSNENLIGLSHYQVFPEISEEWKAVHRRSMDGERIVAHEDRFERMDGTVQRLRWEVRPWHAASEEAGGILIFTEDITARKEAELVLEKERETFRNLTYLASDYFWEFDDGFRFSSLSPVIEERSGIDQGYFLGRALWELPLRNVGDAGLHSLRNALQEHKSFRDFECLLLNGAGKERWLVFSGDPCMSIEGRFRCYRGVAQDITERKRAEKRMRRQAMVFNNAQEGIVITDLKGCLIDANPPSSGFRNTASRRSAVGICALYSRSGMQGTSTRTCGAPSSIAANGRARYGTGARMATYIWNG
jgi:PAS domain S-box-containing protein